MPHADTVMFIFLADVLNQLLNYIQSNFANLTGIVYCMTQKDCEKVGDFLQSNKVWRLFLPRD